MILRECTILWSTGFLLGWGPCLGSCAYVLLPLVGGTAESIPGAWRVWWMFSLGRLTAYAILAACAGAIAGFVDQHFFDYQRGAWIYITLGVIFLISAVLTLRQRATHDCSIVAAQRPLHFLSGFCIAIAPCLPFFSVLSYIAVLSKNSFQGLWYGLAFGAGTLFSSLFLASALAGAVLAKAHKKRAVLTGLRIVSAVVLSAFGVFLISKALYVMRK